MSDTDVKEAQLPFEDQANERGGETKSPPRRRRSRSRSERAAAKPETQEASDAPPAAEPAPEHESAAPSDAPDEDDAAAAIFGLMGPGEDQPAEPEETFDRQPTHRDRPRRDQGRRQVDYQGGGRDRGYG